MAAFDVSGVKSSQSVGCLVLTEGVDPWDDKRSVDSLFEKRRPWPILSHISTPF
jgi:hypothetical protein